MGFLLFAARKMQLKREINANSYEQIKIQDQLQAATKKTAAFQEQMTQMRSIFNVANKTLYANALQNNYGSVGENINQDNYQAQLGLAQQSASALTNAVSNVTDSIFTAVNNVQLAQLKAEEDKLTTKKQSLEMVAKLLNTEYEQYDQQISAEVKEAAPKFGLA